MNTNTDKKTILVSGASGIVGYGILKSLRSYNSEIKLIGTTIYEDSIVPAFCDIFEKAPLTNDENYINWLIEIIKKYNVDMIIPGIEVDVFVWNDNKDLLDKTGTHVLLNNSELINLCVDKWLFYEKLVASEPELSIDSRLTGTFEELEKAFGLPFLLKPRRGYGSKGIVKVNDENTFNENKKNLGEILMAQPIVGNIDEEYTISAFFDNDNNLLCHMSLKRKLSKQGFTEKAEVAEIENAKDAIKKLSKIFKPVGPTNFQFRVQNGQLKLLEINPRISSATSIRTAFGYNESAISIEYFLNQTKISQPKIKKGHAIRYTEDYVVYDSNNI